jgi:hypothetical protein
MIKIKLYELDKHRNECAFRPYLWAKDIIREIGIEFTDDDSYDYAWVAQTSISNKKLCLEESVETGLEFLEKIKGDYMILDGQDSTSLIGTYEVFKESNALLLLKNSLLKDRSLYKKGLTLGRYYWGDGDYKLDDFDDYSDRIVLSGTNWLSTHFAGINVQWYDNIPKTYDISAMFQYPQGVDVYEHGFHQSIHYDNHRKPMMDIINKLNYNVAKLENGKRVSTQEYYKRISSAKILLAPFGYGEMAPRDLEAAMFGSILIKPDMSYIDSKPDVYEDGVTYVACKHDYSDLEEKIHDILGNYENYLYIVENARKRFEEKMNPYNIALHLFETFKTLTNIKIE